MVVNGKTVLFINGKQTRACGSFFNRMLRKNGEFLRVCDERGNAILPSKGLDWKSVAAQIRAGKKVQAAVDAPKSRKRAA